MWGGTRYSAVYIQCSVNAVYIQSSLVRLIDDLVHAAETMLARGACFEDALNAILEHHNFSNVELSSEVADELWSTHAGPVAEEMDLDAFEQVAREMVESCNMKKMEPAIQPTGWFKAPVRDVRSQIATVQWS